MAIPEGRMSTEPVESPYGPPENRKFYATKSYEKGPIVIENTTEGLLYQNWSLTWNRDTGDLIALPETTQLMVNIGNLIGLLSIAFTFDQNGRISYTYSTAVSSFLYWYDSALAQMVTTDLGVDVITPALLLDDKRQTQNTSNDMLLWYTKTNGETFDLYMLLQRERFLIEHLMASGLENQYIHNIGMNDGLRVQITLKNKRPNIPYEGTPIEPPTQENPTIQIISPTTLPVYNTQDTKITLSGVASDNVLVTSVTWINDAGGSGTAVGTTNWLIVDIPLVLGINNIIVTAHDVDANTGIDGIAVEYTEVVPPVDTEDPVITIVSTNVVGNLITIAGLAVDNVAVIQVTWVNSLGGSGIATGTDNWTVNITLLEGNNIITMTAHDAAGNSNDDIHQEIYNAPVDTEDPIVTIVNSNVINDILTLTGTATDNVGVTQVTWVNNLGGTGTAIGTDNWSDDIQLYEGTNIITVTAHDAAANTGNATHQELYTIPAAIDPDIVWAGPDINAKVIGPVGQTSLINFKMDLFWGDPNEATAWYSYNADTFWPSWLNRQPLDNEFWIRVSVLSNSGNPTIIIKNTNGDTKAENVPFLLSTTGTPGWAYAGIYNNVIGTKSATLKIEICKDNGSGAPDGGWAVRNAYCKVIIIP